MKQFSFNAWFYFGILGFLVFLFTRPLNDFNASSPMSDTPTSIKTKVRYLAEELGISMDSLQIHLIRKQQVLLYKSLKNAHPKLPSPADLQAKDVPLTYWEVGLINTKNASLGGDNKISIKNTPIKLALQDDGKIFKIETNNDKISFIEGDSLESISKKIVQNLLGFSLTNYDLVASLDSSYQVEQKSETKHLNNSISVLSEGLYNYQWVKNDLSQLGPLKIELILKPATLEDASGRVRIGATIESANTFYVDEQIEKNQTEIAELKDILSLIIPSILLFAFVVIVSIRQIYHGLIDWKRGFLILFVVIVITSLWYGLYLFQSAYWVVSGSMIFIYLINIFVTVLLLGIFVSLAYVTWDSLARKQNHIQLPLLDALWRGKIFFKETGQAIIYGYSVAGILTGILAVGLLGFGLSFYQHDSSYGFAEATSIVPYLSIPLNALGFAIYGVLAPLALIDAVFSAMIRYRRWATVLIVLISAMFLSSFGRFLGTEADYWKDYIIYLFIAIPLIIAYRRLGFLTVSTAWGAFAMIIMMMPFYNPDSTSIIIVFFILLGIFLLPLIFGFIAAKYGDSVRDEGDYIPEYAERISRQLRVEKEIEIARESQFELLPVNTPDLPEAMIYGFFIPSFEVGGDYYDFFTKFDGNQKPRSLAITVVDVSGKAMRAAVHAIHTSGLILSRFPTDLPHEVLSRINPFVFQKTDKRTFITCVTAEYFFYEKKILIANAGHCRPVLKRNGKAEFIRTPEPNYPLGVMREVTYQPYELQLQTDDIVLFYSDGLPEAQNTRGERFGFENVLSLMEEMDTDKDTSSEICQYIKRKVQTFSAYQMVDDTTIVALKIK